MTTGRVPARWRISPNGLIRETRFVMLQPGCPPNRVRSTGQNPPRQSYPVEKSLLRYVYDSGQRVSCPSEPGRKRRSESRRRNGFDCPSLRAIDHTRIPPRELQPTAALKLASRSTAIPPALPNESSVPASTELR